MSDIKAIQKRIDDLRMELEKKIQEQKRLLAELAAVESERACYSEERDRLLHHIKERGRLLRLCNTVSETPE